MHTDKNKDNKKELYFWIKNDSDHSMRSLIIVVIISTVVIIQ